MVIQMMLNCQVLHSQSPTWVRVASNISPILNLSETGILGVGALSKEVVLEGDSVKQVSRIPLSLTFDHQILDGASADFLKVLAKYIENPYLLIL